MAAPVSGLGYEGATVVLTGGASGLGEGAARLLGEMGASVHIVDIAEPKVPHASYTPVDLADPASVDAALASLKAIGPIDYLLPIAGIPPHLRGPLDCFLVNYAGTRQFTEGMLPQVRNGGAVGLISSTAARGWQSHLDEHLELSRQSDPAKLRAFFEAHPERLRDGYSTSKELLIVWIMQVAPELAERGVRINCIAPCPIDTAFMAMTRERLGEGFMNSYPYPLLGRMPTGEEQAWSLLMLSSPLNSCVTGSVLFTDQGYAGGLLTGSLQPAQYSPPPTPETEPA